MAQNVYETMFLVDPNQASADWDGVVQHANGIIEKFEGEILISHLWGENKLAYPIEKFRKGTYLLTYFRADSANITQMEREFRISNTILRNMTLKLHPKIAQQKLDSYSSDSPKGDAEGTTKETKEEKTAETKESNEE